MNCRFRMFFLGALLCVCASGLHAQGKRKVIVDQDASGPGGSDMQAILSIVNSPDTDVLGITILPATLGATKKWRTRSG